MNLDKSSVAKLAVTVALLVMLLYAVSSLGSLEEARETLGRASLPLVAAAFLVHTALIVYYSFRWRAVLHQLGLDLSVARSLRIHFAAVFVGNITPSRIGELVKVSIYRETVDESASIGTITISVLIDRLGDLSSVGALSIVLGLLLYAWTGDDRLLLVLLWCVSVAVLALLVWAVVEGWHVGFIHRVDRWGAPVPSLFLEYSEKLHHSGGTNRAIAIAVVLGAIGYLPSALKNLFLVQAVGGDLSFLEVLLVTPIVASAGLVPFTFGGIGAVEAGYFVLFTILGLSVEAAIGVAVLNRVVSLAAVYILGGVAALASSVEVFSR